MFRKFINPVWDRWANLHPFVRFLIFSIVLIAAGLFVGKPLFGMAKSWKLERNLTNAKKAENEVRMEDARDLSLSVIQAGDPRIEAARILESSMGALNDPRQTNIARYLMLHPQGTDADRLQGFCTIAADSPMGQVGQAWSSLKETNKKDPAFIIALADRLIKEQMLIEAAGILRSTGLKDEPSEIRIRLIRVLLLSGSGESVEEAQRRIAKEWNSDHFAEYMDLIESIPIIAIKPELLATIEENLLNNPPPDAARAALFSTRLALAAKPAELMSILDVTISRWKSSAPEAVAKLLADLGFNQRLIEEFPLEIVANKAGMFPLLLNAYQEAGEWGKMKSLLDQYGTLLPRYILFTYRSIHALRIGNTGSATQEWESALAEAKTSNHPNPYLEIYQIVSRLELQDKAERALLEAIRLGRGPLPVYSSLKPLVIKLYEQKRESEIIMICSVYFSFESQSQQLLCQYAYLACMNDLVEPVPLLKAIEPMAEKSPDVTPLQFVLVSIQLAAGRPAEAEATLQRLTFKSEELSLPHQAANLVTQAMNHKIQVDDPRLTKFPWKLLLPSEQRKYTELLNSVKK